MNKVQDFIGNKVYHHKSFDEEMKKHKRKWEVIQEDEELYQKGSFSKGLVLDALPRKGEIFPKMNQVTLITPVQDCVLVESFQVPSNSGGVLLHFSSEPTLHPSPAVTMATNTTLKTSSSSSCSFSSHRWSNDVFLSFRGKDTRKNFTGHLYSALTNAGINTFWDNDELRRGEDISTGLHNAIQESKIAIIVFSINYAGSRWCLEELLKIMECRKTFWQLVLPIFYDVDPLEVRKQTGSFGEAFNQLKRHYLTDMDKVADWRNALTEARNLAGFPFGANSASTMDIVVNIVSDFKCKTFHHLQSLSENMEKLERKCEQLNHQKGDVELKLKANLWPKEKQKREIELWLANVERINDEKQSIENEAEEVKFSKCASLIERFAHAKDSRSRRTSSQGKAFLQFGSCCTSR